MKSGKVTETENRVITQPRPNSALNSPGNRLQGSSAICRTAEYLHPGRTWAAIDPKRTFRPWLSTLIL